MNRPSDWPGSGPIDLAVHDLPHASSTTEWWYQNAHCKTKDGRSFSLFAAFFRQVKGHDPAGKPQYAHTITWALIDLDKRENLFTSGVDPSAPREGLKRIQCGIATADHRWNRALMEIFERGNVPTPDHIVTGPVEVSLDRLALRYGTDSFVKQDDGSYRLQLHNPREDYGCDVSLTPTKPAVRHGIDGVVRGSDDASMFYYFVPRCELSGTIHVGGETLEIAEGQAWYDHEFGVGDVIDPDLEAEQALPEQERKQLQVERRQRIGQRQVAWDWLSLQLDDGSELCVYVLVYSVARKLAGNHTVHVAPDGKCTVYDDALFEAKELWQSSQSFFEYPVKWHLRVPSANIDLQIEAAFKDQEFITLISKPSFWEGRVDARGTINGKAVAGPGVIERSGFAPFEDLDGFFEQVGRLVRKSVSELIPVEPSYEAARGLIASDELDHYMEGVDLKQYGRTHLAPIREIVDRGGKGWRSYAAITCCDIVGGNSRHFIQWLALPEMMHVGSLIVDDVEDRSTTRRGGKTAHLIYGEAQAINSGTAAYFICNSLLKSERISAEEHVRIYDLYFTAMRAGHAGQAIDIDGFEEIIPHVLETGDGSELEKRVLAVHRLKTAAPAGCLARMGAIAGKGTEAQIDGVGRFFEDLGLAFQIIDDVLNLRGFKGDLKAKAEDIQQGKVTLPVAKALSTLEPDKRNWLYQTVASKPSDQKVVGEVVQVLEDCGALDACHSEARQLVEDGWRRLEPLVEDSLAKMMLRAFGWYILERHY